MTPDLATMARIASLYYLDDRSQAEIAEQFGISRIKVGRLLKAARDIGVVEIRIQTPPALSLDLEGELKRRFGLKQALLAPEQDSEEAQRQLVGQIAANYLSPQVREGTVVAVGMGRNVAATADAAAGSAVGTAEGSTFVCAIGGAADIDAGLNSGDICRRFAEHFGGRSEMLYAPAYADSREVHDSFLRHDDVCRVIDLASSAQLAVVGIGDACQESAVVRIGCFAGHDMTRMRQAGAVGDILGYFFDIRGEGLTPGMSDRVITPGHERLREIPCVIGVAAEDGKAQSLLGALRTGILDVIATTAANAREILDLDGRPH